MTSEILKIDPDQRLVFGFASVADEVDTQNDVISETELEKSAYNFVLNSRRGGAMHTRTVGRLVESCFFSKAKQQALGIDLGRVAWLVGFKIDDDATWDEVKKGKLSAFSIHGKARRAKI